jgi:hypothetical protein
MQNVSDVTNEPVTVRLTLVSLTRSGIFEAEAVIGQMEGVAVLEVKPSGDLSQCSKLSAPSSGVVARLGYRLAQVRDLVDVRVRRVSSRSARPWSGDG